MADTPLNVMRALLSVLLACHTAAGAGGMDLGARPQDRTVHEFPGIDPGAESFVIDVRIDPVVAAGGDMLVVAGLGIDATKEGVGPWRATLEVDLREGGVRSIFGLRRHGRNLAGKPPDPKTPGWVDTGDYQRSNELEVRDGEGHHLSLVVWPEGEGSWVRLFVDAMDRPKEEHFLEDRIKARTVVAFSLHTGSGEPRRTSRFSDFTFKEVSVEEAGRLPEAWETVLAAIDPEYPPMGPVIQAIEEGDTEKARRLFVGHMRTRSAPPGPKLDKIPDTVLHPDWQTIADMALDGQYGTVGFFARFSKDWKDTNGDTHTWALQNEPRQLRWSRCNGHLNRHFHWVSLAKAWEANGDGRYAKLFSDEVFDWVSREPFFWERTPTIGGLNLMDGTTFRWGYMNTSNIGRRLELTWWPAYETFRKAPEFSDESHFAMLLGMIRQAELITNPSSFAVHDDGAAHTTIGLLKTAMMLPEFKASARWKAIAEVRWDEMLARQFHPDGSHVSLSTGYNWATILALENFIRLIEQFGGDVPEKYLRMLAKAAEHPMLLTRPNQGQIDLNDGGWSTIEDRYQSLLKWFPDRPDFQWMASKGAKGSPPEQDSIYFPNAGHYAMRTGWGLEEKYLFFGAGPWGASHGKQDALNVYAQLGDHLLIRNAGRGSYSGVGNTVHAGRSLSFNTLSPDWAQENSIPHWKQEMHRGFGPPKRRWLSNERFDYGEGAFAYGWHRTGEHIQGKWVRQVVFVKGEEPTRDGYFLVIDTVEPADEKERTWRHPWQLGLNPPEIEIREEDKSIVASNSAVAVQILPVDPRGNLELTVIQGQEIPELLGWRVYGETATPYPTPTYAWRARGVFSRAWVIQMHARQEGWPVASVETLPSESPAELRFTVHRKNGGSDHILRRFPGGEPTVFDSENVESDLVILSRDGEGRLASRLRLPEGKDSVAKRNPPTIRKH